MLVLREKVFFNLGKVVKGNRLKELASLESKGMVKDAKQLVGPKFPHRGVPMANARGYHDPHAKLRNLLDDFGQAGQKFTKPKTLVNSPAYGVKRPLPNLKRPTPIYN